MYVPTGKAIFRKSQRRSNPYRVLFLLTMLLAVLFVYRSYASGEIEPPFTPTPTPTRVPYSYALEADTRFRSGDLDGAILAYKEAIEMDPENAMLLAELARLQTYSSTQLTTDSGKRARLQEALANIDRAVELDPDSSSVHAIRTFVLDWNANRSLVSEEEHVRMLSLADQSALTAINLDGRNALALAFYAELQVDQQRWGDAEQTIEFAKEADSSLMDVHRVDAYVNESMADYEGAIEAYQRAIAINPNMTYLHMMIGYNYRTLAGRVTGPNALEIAKPIYEQALESFARVVDINKQLSIQDPIPYIAIAKTYAQQGEFFAASWNILTAVELSPQDATLYGEAGIIFYKARNYETAELALRCAVRGCNAEISCEVRQCNPEADPPMIVQGLDLSEGSKWYYLHLGSVLAALHRQTAPKCPEAIQVFREIRAQYSDDPLFMNIVEVGESTCDYFGGR